VGERVALLSDRAYAEYDIADESKVMHLPDSLAYQDVPAEPLGCAMNIFRRSEIKTGQDVAVVGVGFLGALITQMASNAGANVIAVARRPFALQVARESGAAHLVEMTDRRAAVEQIQKLTGDLGCDIVVEATGKQEPLDLASDIVKVRGRLVIAGYHQDGSRQINMQLWNWKGLDVVNAHERDPGVYLKGMKAAVGAIASGVISASRLYTHTFSLDQLGRALDMTQQRPEGFMKALIKL
jgi:threonine dehydrogenase-like Zn-dependent dehydrogenase